MIIVQSNDLFNFGPRLLDKSFESWHNFHIGSRVKASVKNGYAFNFRQRLNVLKFIHIGRIISKMRGQIHLDAERQAFKNLENFGQLFEASGSRRQRQETWECLVLNTWMRSLGHVLFKA